MSIVAAETAGFPLKLATKTSRRFILGALRYIGPGGTAALRVGEVRDAQRLEPRIRGAHRADLPGVVPPPVLSPLEERQLRERALLAGLVQLRVEEDARRPRRLVLVVIQHPEPREARRLAEGPQLAEHLCLGPRAVRVLRIERPPQVLHLPERVRRVPRAHERHRVLRLAALVEPPAARPVALPGPARTLWVLPLHRPPLGQN